MAITSSIEFKLPFTYEYACFCMNSFQTTVNRLTLKINCIRLIKKKNVCKKKVKNVFSVLNDEPVIKPLLW